MTQNKQVLLWLQKYGTITDIEAYKKFRIRRLSARIYDLKKQGYNIMTEIKSRKEDGKTYTYAVYYYFGKKVI